MVLKMILMWKHCDLLKMSGTDYFLNTTTATIVKKCPLGQLQQISRDLKIEFKNETHKELCNRIKAHHLRDPQYWLRLKPAVSDKSLAKGITKPLLLSLAVELGLGLKSHETTKLKLHELIREQYQEQQRYLDRFLKPKIKIKITEHKDNVIAPLGGLLIELEN